MNGDVEYVVIKEKKLNFKYKNYFLLESEFELILVILILKVG